MHKFLNRPEFTAQINSFCLPHSINWPFIPPDTPHFGGLWEANIKSCKSILKRITGTQVYTQEEWSTLFTQIEAIMNSRPLSALSVDCHDCNVLTPGHFLIGRPLITLPSKDYSTTPSNKLTRWNLLQQQQQRFCKLWSSDYLLTLQQRSKWRTPNVQFHVGDLVVIKDENTPTNLWPLARITAVQPSARDHLVRVVAVKTQNSSYTRPITKLIRLPLPQETE
ncbi:PREDICTED: uncharacterized protein LOC107171244 [Diuraphis noxia]|uniref:uncharacterized protein LOC107171244 n=1 Tax=Diuraphis noxia TaxID=143948 RepID=UPI0007635886|nr:PREDICTED: uncharacterized protein LOC107171244 [Diuraphis noxia]